jgi:hypothetical protein
MHSLHSDSAEEFGEWGGGWIKHEMKENNGKKNEKYEERRKREKIG